MPKLLLGLLKTRLTRKGQALSRSRHQFAADDFWAQVQLVRPHFDARFYLVAYPDVAASGMDPLLHFCATGWREDRRPSPEFSPADYLAAHPEVTAMNLNPLVHAALCVMDDAAAREERLNNELALIARHLDREHYLAQNPDVAEAGADPVEHFARYGWREGRNPAPAFALQPYLEAHPALRGLGLNPFVHHILRQGEAAEAAGDDLPYGPEPEAVMRALAPVFDAVFYLHRNPEVAAQGVDPLEHYCRYGWTEGRDPAPAFSTRFYLESNPDVAEAGLNPFFHFVTQGQFEGRLGRHPGGSVVENLRHQTPLETMVTEWLRARQGPVQGIDRDTLTARLMAALEGATQGLILSVGHDDYLSNSGGVQLCIQQEARRAAEFGAAYLNIHPVYPIPRLAHEKDDPDPVVMLVLDGQRLGACRMSDLIAVVAVLRPEIRAAHVVIHHLMGHAVAAITDLVRACGTRECHLWLHDFFTICPSFTLQRNAISFCGAPSPLSNACRLCLYGAERLAHRAAMTQMFQTLRVHVLSPSEVTLRFWKDRAGLEPASVSVRPHLTLDWRRRARALPARDVAGPVTVAFVGSPAAYKGWAQFVDLAAAHASDPRYRFVYFGARAAALPDVAEVKVHVSADAPDAMIRAIKDRNVDLVVSWNAWPETFSLSNHEALAAGAFVLTHSGSGNIAALVEATGRGAVLRDPQDLLDAFSDGRALAMARQARKKRRTEVAEPVWGEMSLGVLAPERMAS